MTAEQKRRPDRELAKAVSASKAPAISRAAAVLRLLGKSDAPMSLQAIANELGLVPSTCLYVLRALAAEEFVAFDPATKRYSLEAGVLTLARHWLRRNQFSDFAQPALNRISQAFGVTVLGVQIVGLEHIVVVAVSQGGENFQLSAQVGSRFPALISATGRCIAAHAACSEDELENRFKKLRWDNPPAFEIWKNEVSQARTQGFAIDDGNYIAGVTVVAAPIWKRNVAPSHAIVAIGISSVLKRSGLPKLRQALVAEAKKLTGHIAGEAQS